MKKIRLLLMAFGLLMAIVSSGQIMTFRLANPSIDFVAGVNYLNFDIEVMGSAEQFLWSGQAVLNFNSLVLSSDQADWFAVPKGSLLDGKYPNPVALTGVKYPSLVSTVSSGVFNLAWAANSALVSKSPGATYFNPVITSWQSVATVTVKIVNANAGLAGISFVTSSMATQQFYQQAASTTANYSVAYSTDMTNLYVGRIFASALGWTQTGGGATWVTALNTSVWDGNAILPAGSLSNAGAVRIHSGATLTVPPTGQLTAASLENNTANGLNIQSDAGSTGSLITSAATGAGTTTMQRYMVASSWRIAASPLAGQGIGAFITANPTIASAPGGLRGMTDYNMTNNTWNSFFSTGISGNIEVGKGYMLRAAASGAGSMTFAGSLTAGDKPVTTYLAGTNWNAIGNPYTSAVTVHDLINQNKGSGGMSSFENGYEAVYVYNGSSYDILNLSSSATSRLQSGQGFFVKGNNVVGNIIPDVLFKPAMQVHDNSAVLKSGAVTPEIKLIANNSNSVVSTSIRFIAGTSKGFDRGYDAGAFKADLPVSIYTKLVEDNNIQYGIQCLPGNDLSGMVIPVGIESKAGGSVIISSETMNLPADYKIILEDKLLKQFTDLNKNVYSATIEANINTSDRFQLHTSYLTTGLDENFFNGKLSAYAIRNVEIRIKGDVSKQAVATLYDVQGRAILTKVLEGGSLNTMRTPNIKTGLYMLFVKDGEKIQGFKIPVKE